MEILTLACPKCGLSRQLPGQRLPDTPCRVVCPRCRCSFIYAKPPAKPASPTASRRPGMRRPVRHWELTPIPGLVKESWQLFRSRFSTLVGLFLLSLAAFASPAALAASLNRLIGLQPQEPATILIWTSGVAASLCLGFCCFSAFLCAVAEDGLSARGSIARGRGVAAGLIWVAFLGGFVVSGGLVLLVLPGVVFAVWFSFAQFVLIREDYRGMDALLKSREYVRGRWGRVALRLLLVWTALLAAAAVPVAGPLLAVLFFPYLAIVHYLIYRDLREMKGEVPFPFIPVAKGEPSPRQIRNSLTSRCNSSALPRSLAAAVADSCAPCEVC